MFQRIQELIDDHEALVCVLIDEVTYMLRFLLPLHNPSQIVYFSKFHTSMLDHSQVESLTAARQSAMSGSEPSDAIRVVNALLTQLDQIKRHSNVIILTTSNITGAIDLAFVDRYTHNFIVPSLYITHVCIHFCLTN